ncbi:MAG: CooT family nickel-binding protein [Deltaproteobacteria bacterium]|nr:CooT family nickel-binding protein [Deltaproteobacteria bacterium]
MCQMSVVYEENGTTKTVMDNVTYLEAAGGGIRVSTLFEEPRIIPSAFVKRIDFMGGTVTLAPLGEEKNV